jgi:pyridoxine 4-dehydrogenase
VTAPQYAEGSAIAKIVCVQNHYNLAHRGDDDLIDLLAAQSVAYGV